MITKKPAGEWDRRCQERLRSVCTMSGTAAIVASVEPIQKQANVERGSATSAAQPSAVEGSASTLWRRERQSVLARACRLRQCSNSVSNLGVCGCVRAHLRREEIATDCPTYTANGVASTSFMPPLHAPHFAALHRRACS